MLLILLGGYGWPVHAQSPPPPDDPTCPKDGDTTCRPETAVQDTDLRPYDDYDQRLRAAQQLTRLGSSLFGDEVSLSNGATTFSVVDIDLPGNSTIPVQLRRSFAIEPRRGFDGLGGFGVWDLDLPHLVGVFDGTWRWNTGGNGATQRCSQLWVPRTPSGVDLGEIWSGTSLHLPGQGDSELLYLSPALGHAVPTTGGPYPWAARGDVRFSCTSSTANGYPGQGFVAHLPNGTRYRLDVGIERSHGFLQKNGLRHPRTRVYLMPSRIEDRFGQGVTFTWNGDKLASIQADDGRRIELAWSGDRIVSASAHGRLWSYTYAGTVGEAPATAWLSEVVLPDSATWRYARAGTLVPESLDPDAPNEATCPEAGLAEDSFVFTATHPSGAQGVFTLPYRRHYRSGVPAEACVADGNGNWSLSIPDHADLYSLTSKVISGPALTTQTTSYGYTASSPFGRTTGPVPCLSCPASKTTEVTAPDGGRHTYRFGVVHGLNDGRLLGTAIRSPAGVLLREETTTYLSETEAATMPFPDVVGTLSGSSEPSASRIRPVTQTTVSQQGASFQWSGSNFDAKARPRTMVRASSLGHSRTEALSYFDHTGLWVLGQVARVQVGSLIPEETSYDPASALPTHRYAFGQLQWRRTYHTSGAEAGLSHEVYDGGNENRTVLSSYRRGIPQTVLLPTGASVAAGVNDHGEIVSVTDAMGFITGYGYDALGRLTSIVPPVGDSVAWARTDIVYTQVGSAEYGLPAGHWRRTETTGERVNETFFDALWQPVLTRQSASDGSAALRAVRRSFDHAGRETFVSWPSAGMTSVTDSNYLTLTQGSWQTFDALGRATGSGQDSELGLLTTSTAYTAPFRTVHTDARGNSTTTTYHAFDQPAYDAPLQVSSPEGITTTYTRDMFGKPLTLSRSGSYTPPGGAAESLSLIRRFVYDPQQRLCKTIEPDAGTTVLDYDAAGNLAWNARGQNGLTSTTDCQRGSVAAGVRSQYRYDAMNRLLFIDHPAGTEDVGYTWFADGAMQTATTGALSAAVPPTWASKTSEWSYAYNRRRLLTSETLGVDGRNFVVSHLYNVRGDLQQLTYPSGHVVTFQPNAYGEPRQAGSYASNVTYHPNGMLAGFTYGNTATRSVSLNLRQLPSRLLDQRSGVTLFDHSLTYDQAGNLGTLTDGLPGGLESRTLGYDGQNRLVSVGAAPAGTESYAYDPLDRVRRVVQAGVDRRFSYDPTTHRLSQVSPQGSSAKTDYSWNLRGELATRSRTVGAPAPAPMVGRVFGNGFEPGASATGTRSYGFDAAGRMVSTNDGLSYRYDAHGRRVSTVMPLLGTRYQVYSRAGELLYVDDSSRNERTEFIYLGSSLVAERTRPQASETAIVGYLHSDHRGTPSVKTASNGIQVYRSRLKAYGDPYDGIWREGPGFTKHAMDEGGELIYMQQRYYDPEMFGFLSTDPVGADARNFNRYWYANNNPYTFVDPDGRWARLAGSFVSGFVEEAAIQYLTTGNVDAGEAATAAAIGMVNPGKRIERVAGALGFGNKADAGEATTTLYRAVGPDELSDIQNTGQLINRGSAEGKYFTSSSADASSYAQQAVSGFGDAPYTTIKVDVPNSMLPSPVSVDGGIPAFVLPDANLPGLKPQVLDSMAIPERRR